MFFIAPYYKGEESYNNMVSLIPQHYSLTLFISA